jgi:hypothetical protein
MTEKRKKIIEKELHQIQRQLGVVSGVKKRHQLLKRQLLLKKEIKTLSGNRK